MEDNMKKKIALIMFLTLFCTCFAQSLNVFAAVQGNKYVNDFNSVDNLKDFDAYWVPDMGVSDKETTDKHWKIQDGSVVRINDINTQGATKNMSVLSLKNYVFMNFEATYKFKQGSNPSVNWGWCVFSFRQNTPGSYFVEDGAGAFLGVDGVSYLWGASVGGPYKSTPIAGYAPSTAFDDIKIRVVGKSFTMYVNGNKTFEQTLDSKSLVEGYVSFTSVGTDCKIDQFTITNLDDKGNVIPLFNENAPTSSISTTPSATTTSSTATNSNAATSSVATGSSTASVASSSQAFPNEVGDENKSNNQLPLPFMIIISIVLFIDTCGVAFLIVKSIKGNK